MNIKKITIGSFFIFIVAAFVLFLIHAFDSCRMFFSWSTCHLWEIGLVRPLGVIAFAVCVSSLPYFLVTQKIYQIWFRFGLSWMLLTLLLLTLSPVNTKSGPMMDLFSDSPRDETALFLAIPFVVISWLIALWGVVRKGK